MPFPSHLALSASLSVSPSASPAVPASCCRLESLCVIRHGCLQHPAHSLQFGNRAWKGTALFKCLGINPGKDSCPKSTLGLLYPVARWLWGIGTEAPQDPKGQGTILATFKMRKTGPSEKRGAVTYSHTARRWWSWVHPPREPPSYPGPSLPPRVVPRGRPRPRSRVPTNWRTPQGSQA